MLPDSAESISASFGFALLASSGGHRWIDVEARAVDCST